MIDPFTLAQTHSSLETRPRLQTHTMLEKTLAGRMERIGGYCLSESSIAVVAMNTPSVENTIRAALASQAGIRMLILFGSLATGHGTQESDIDLAIDAGRPLDAESKTALIGKLAECTGRPVDLIDLRTVGEPLLGQILKHGRRLVGDDAVYAELIKRHVFEEADFMSYYRRILSERRNAWIAK